MSSPEAFFAFARERHHIFLARAAGRPAPWTDDPVLASTRFTNVFRELDRVTLWFRANLRDRLARQPRDVVPWTVIFRWFNRIETGEALLRHYHQMHPDPGMLGKFDRDLAEAIIREELPRGPWVTGSYMVCSGRNNGDKLSGMLSFCQQFVDWWDEAGQYDFLDNRDRPLLTLQQAHELLVPRPGLSGFTAYEVVTDLRWTDAVRPVDRDTWAHAGPGASRGGSRVLGRHHDHLRQESRADQEVLRALMVRLLRMSRDPAYWPQEAGRWPRWELREVEHTLCEFDKYERVRRGQGRAKNRFRPDLAGPLPDSRLGL